MALSLLRTTAFLLILVSITLPYNVDADCMNRADEAECDKDCKEDGYAYGACEYSECNCYGRSSSTSVSNRNNPQPRQQQPSLPAKSMFCAPSRDNCDSFCQAHRANFLYSQNWFCCCQFN